MIDDTDREQVEIYVGLHADRETRERYELLGSDLFHEETERKSLAER